MYVCIMHACMYTLSMYTYKSVYIYIYMCVYVHFSKYMLPLMYNYIGYGSYY